MKLLCITDLHNNRTALERILAATADLTVEMILLGGDITNFGSPDDAEVLVRDAQDTGATVLAVAGNCDSAGIDRRLAELGVSLAGRGVIHGEIGLHGISAIPPWRSGMYQFTEEELAEVLSTGYAQLGEMEHHVVLSHVPPCDGRLDRTRLFFHAGSTALRDFIDATRPVLVVCGHVHECRGTEQIGRTTVVNCGPATNGCYVVAEVGNEVNVELCRA